MNKWARLFFFLLVVLLALGCQRTETGPLKKTGTEPERQETLLIGLIPEQNIFKQIGRYLPLADYLFERVGVTISSTA
jgi:ABC-type phosphate/phosphonate transport system substrate-binding protein